LTGFGEVNQRICMSYKKGDIVIVRFPFVLKSGDESQKGRPALVISNDQVERSMAGSSKG